MQFTLYQRLLASTPEDVLLDRNMSCVIRDNIQINILKCVVLSDFIISTVLLTAIAQRDGSC
jgi:hypothetical protein